MHARLDEPGRSAGALGVTDCSAQDGDQTDNHREREQPVGSGLPVEGNAAPGYSKEFWQWYDNYAAPRLVGPRTTVASSRAITFRRMMEHLDRFDRPVVIVETGAAGERDNWDGNGCSTIIFDQYVHHHPGSRLMSVDTDWDVVSTAREIAPRAQVSCADSVKFLSTLAHGTDIQIDLLFLDATHLNWAEPVNSAQIHHLNELLAIKPALRPDSLVVVDDSPILLDSYFPEVGGKGGLVVKHALEAGAAVLFAEYQVGMVGFNIARDPATGDQDVDVKQALRTASELANCGRNLEAAYLFRVIYGLTRTPLSTVDRVAHSEACLFFAKIAVSNNKLGAASDWYEEAIRFSPEYVPYRLEWTKKVLSPVKHWVAAWREAQICTEIEPDNITAWMLLGEYEHELAHADKCKAAYLKAIEIDPKDPRPKLFLISIYCEEGDNDAVEKLAHELIESGDPSVKGDAVQSLAFIAYRRGQHEESIRLYDEALALGVTQEPTAHWNRSLPLQALGRYKEGWKEMDWRRYERTQPALKIPIIRFTMDMWRHEPALMIEDGKERRRRLHVHAEAGAGDNFCCVRYFKQLIDEGYDVRFECYANMVGLMRRSFPQVTVTEMAKDYPGVLGVQPFDSHVPSGELPHVLETDLDTVPWWGPYLVPDPQLVREYARKLGVNKRALKRVGLCWSSGIRTGLWITRYGRRKSMHWDDLSPVIDCGLEVAELDSEAFLWLPQCVSLQVGPEREQNNHLADDLLPEEPSWDDTAALIANLDLVITVDTAVAHLAGAMGKPVWLMNSAEPGSWHWMAERPGSPWNERSPWYPSVKIYRQKTVGDWSDVVARIAADLRSFCGGPPRNVLDS